MSTIVVENVVEALGEAESGTDFQLNEEVPNDHDIPSIKELYFRFITPLQRGSSESECVSCGIPINAVGGYQVDGLDGVFHNRFCLEQGIFYKDDPQRTESKAAHLGSGELLCNYVDGLSKTHPEINGQSLQSSTRLCANDRCKKGPNETRDIAKSQRAKYCSDSCRVAVSRRDGKSKGMQTSKPLRKRRSDAKYDSHAERQGAYEARTQAKRHPEEVQTDG